jgi:uncharacterized membrane protein
LISCTKCHAQIAEGSTFCSECGHQLIATLPPPYDIYCSKCGQALHPAQKAAKSAKDAEFNVKNVQAAVPDNAACVLCYLFGWVTGLAFLVTDKRRNVRFHAAQSTIIFGALNLLLFFLGRYSSNAFIEQLPYAWAAMISTGVLGMISVGLWVILMVNAYERKGIRIPIVAPLADLIAGKPSAGEPVSGT